MVQEYGREQIRTGSLHHTIVLDDSASTVERAVYRGEVVLVQWATREGKRLVEDVFRLEARDGGLRSLTYYYFCPEVLVEVARELGFPVRTNGYRYTPK
jgi:RNA polymerase sigma-70 factor (ECF subfamily)